MKPLTLVFTALLLALGAPTLSAAEDPLTALQGTVDQVLDKLYGENAVPEAERAEAVREAVGGTFSFYTIARRALGRNWSELNATQQERFVELFTDLLVRTYADRYEGDSPPEVTWGKTQKLGDKRMEIYSTVEVNGEPAEVMYRLALLDGEWQVYDVIGEGVSLVSNYRDQFNSLINRGGPEALLKELEAKNVN